MIFHRIFGYHTSVIEQENLIQLGHQHSSTALITH
jgi:hypothetical protein